jgi:hypothetical protein
LQNRRNRDIIVPLAYIYMTIHSTGYVQGRGDELVVWAQTSHRSY